VSDRANVPCDASSWDNVGTTPLTRRHEFERRGSVKRLLAVTLLAAAIVPALRAADTPLPSVKVGDMAPDFTLTDQNGNKVSLHDFKGKKNVALAFYIFAFTGG
jgi:hypothetical protein